MSAAPELRIPPRPEMVFGEGAVATLPDLVAELRSDAAFVVSDAGVVGAGVAGPVLDGLRHAGVRVGLFDRVGANPTVATVGAGGDALRSFGRAVVVGLGGGSPIDAAKAIALQAANDGPPAELERDNADLRPARPLIAVPTTAGTGAETNAFGVIEDPAQRRKRYLGHPSTVPRYAVLDPALTVSAPALVTAACGIDVLAHAVESIQARSGNPYSAALACEAVRAVWGHLPRVVDDGHDLEGRAAMLLAAHLAALAFASTGLGTAHAIAHALSARHGTPHGVALAAVLPSVAALNLREREAASDRAAAAAGLAGGGRELAAALTALCERAGLHPRLRELGVEPGDLGPLADAALSDVVVRNAPRVPSRGELVELLRGAY